MSRETELRNLALSLVDEFYENQGQGILNNLNKRTYGNLSSDREAVLTSIGESLSEYQDEDGNEMTAEEKAAALCFVKKEIWGYGLIDDLINDKTISDIKIHDAGHIRIKREGRRETSNLAFPSEFYNQTFREKQGESWNRQCDSDFHRCGAGRFYPAACCYQWSSDCRRKSMCCY